MAEKAQKVKGIKAVGLIIRLFRFALAHWPIILITLLAAGIHAGAEGGYLWLVRPFMSDAIGVGEDVAPAADRIEDGVRVAFIAMLLAPLMALGAMAHKYLRMRVVWEIIMDIRNGLCRALLPQSMRFFESKRSGELISRITNDVHFTDKALELVFGDLFLEPLRFFVAFGFAMYYSWQLGLLSLAILVFIALPLAIIGKHVRRSSSKGLERLADLTDSLTQIFSGIRVVKAFQMEDAEAVEFERRNQKFFRRMTRMARAKALATGFTTLLNRGMLALLILLGCVLVGKGIWNIGWPEITGFMASSVIMYAAIRTLSKTYNDLQQALAGAERIFEVLDYRPDIQDSPDAVEVEGLKESIFFNNVSFAYEDEQYVLKDINLKVKRGETVALVGKSGAGKSSLVDLIPRFYDATEGCVEIDGIDIRMIKKDSLLSLIAVVTQQTFLFNRSIADNIRYGRKGNASMDEIIEAAKAANIHDFIISLPEGYDTEVGDYGARLSGGQRQRISIARAILKNAPILILDEAMVGLDSESEAVVRDAVIRLMKDRTTFLIAHDFSTVLHADLIVVMKDGRIVETGTHEELVKLGGEYSRLCALQYGMAGKPDTAQQNPFGGMGGA